MTKTRLLIILIFITLIAGAFWLSRSAFEKIPPAPPAAVATPSVNTAPAENKKLSFEHNKKLQAETDALLPLFDRMPAVPVYLKDEVINKEGTNTERGVAYTICESDEQPVIYMKKVFFEKANRKQLVNILKHELTHAWQCHRKITWGHDEQFRKKFKQVGGFGN